MSALEFRDVADQGIFPFELKEFGRSVEKVPLCYLPSRKETHLLVFAAIHGEEPETTFLLSRALRMLRDAPLHVACVLALNPDGILRGTRGNAHGVDLNRNFPTADWKSGKTLSRSVLEAPRLTELSTGKFPASEPEVRALMNLIRQLKVSKALALHSPLGWIDAEERSKLCIDLERTLGLPWKCGAGYATPGSFGTFAAEQKMDCVTVELPREAPEVLSIRYAEPFARFLRDFEG